MLQIYAQFLSFQTDNFCFRMLLENQKSTQNNSLNRNYFLKIFFVLTATFMLSCKQEQNLPQVSFYYWKTNFKLSDFEENVLKKNDVRNLYIRYFDVDLDSEQKPFPRQVIRFAQKPGNFKIVPVVYIKNAAMLHKSLNISQTAENIIKLINQINTKNNISCNEIQIDCDWTLKSRDNFMKFIAVFKKISQKRLSVTIRLHQIKYYTKTGIPGADSGVLMYYNMGTLAADSLNSVYDRSIAQKYLPSLRKYPLDLDIALPIFYRAVLIRNKKIENLISKVNAQNFDYDSSFLVLDENNIKVKKSNFKFGYYFKENDEIKIESINFEEITEMCNDLKTHLSITPKNLIFYDLDSINLKQFDHENQNFKTLTHHF